MSRQMAVAFSKRRALNTVQAGMAGLSWPVLCRLYWTGPTLAPYVPVSGPEWKKCDGVEATCRGVNERCIASDEDNGELSSSRSSSSSGQCLCVGGFARRAAHEQCRRQRLSLILRVARRLN